LDNQLNIAVIPVDKRPVSYNLPCMTGKLNKNVNIFLPPEEFFGVLREYSDSEKILKWLKNLVFEQKINCIVCSLDTISYGGLIPSRWADFSRETLRSRINLFNEIAQSSGAKIYCFSSIMRISDNNINEEEKIYWDKYGKLIFKYSFLKHKIDSKRASEQEKENFENLKSLIPAEILEDYFFTRQKNFSQNREYLKFTKNNVYDFILYGKDDTAPFGLNVQEAEALKNEIKAENLEDKALLHTGSDEVITMLISRYIATNFQEKIKIFSIFSTKTGSNIIPRYEDKPLETAVKNHIKVCGAFLSDSEDDADIYLLLNTPEEIQNDFAMGEFIEPENKEAVKFCVDFINNSNKPVIIADVASANGSDNLLAQKILSQVSDIYKIYGYAGWNTAGNTIGTALATGLVRFISEKNESFNQEKFNEALFIRFTDDWAYQTVVRQKIRAVTSEADETLLYTELMPLAINMARKFKINPDQIILSFPCKRIFEVKIMI
jgi:hypothetical protein